jgi:hypothetical protein
LDKITIHFKEPNRPSLEMFVSEYGVDQMGVLKFKAADTGVIFGVPFISILYYELDESKLKVV